ncbi:MAG: flavin reductase family protein [Phycisphaerae bacterium]|nr:flavin reductase family protein [Phycisphaerae bacterium]
MQQEVEYSRAIAGRYPEQVVVAIARETGGKCNPITLGWTMITSGSPPMMAVSIGKTRYSLEVFRRAGEFVIAFPSEHQEKEALLFGTKSGRDIDKLKEANTKTQPAKKINCVLMSGAVANFECEIVGELETGDHIIFVGEIVCSHLNERPLNRLYTVGAGYKMGGLPRA